MRFGEPLLPAGVTHTDTTVTRRVVKVDLPREPSANTDVVALRLTQHGGNDATYTLTPGDYTQLVNCLLASVLSKEEDDD